MTTKKPICVLSHRVFAETVELLRPHAELVLSDADRPLSAKELRARCADAEAVMIFMPDRVDAAFLDACPNLRIVAGAFKGADNVDLAACASRDVRVSIVPDLLTVPTAELAIGLTIGLMRHLLDGDGHVRGDDFTGWRPLRYGVGLAGSTVGLVGFGNIGKAIAQRLRGFEVRLLYTEVSPVSFDDEEFRPFEALLAESDVLILCAPLTDGTLRLIDRAAIERMKDGAYLINPARGSLVDETAVAKALIERRLAGYAADVFAFEDLSRSDRPPNVPDALLRQRERTLFTPHLGSAVRAARIEIERSAALNIIDALEGREPRDAVRR